MKRCLIICIMLSALLVFTGCGIKIPEKEINEELIATAVSVADLQYMTAEMANELYAEGLTDEVTNLLYDRGYNSEAITIIESSMETGKGGLITNTTENGDIDTFIGVYYAESEQQAKSLFDGVLKELDAMDGFFCDGMKHESTINLANRGSKMVADNDNIAYVVWYKNYIIYLISWEKAENTGNYGAFFKELT